MNLAIRIHKVQGQSMSPHFMPNDYVISLTLPWLNYKVNDVVLCNHPDFGVIIKRIDTISANDTYQLSSDNVTQGVSQSTLGIQKKHQLIGKVIWQVSAQ